MSRISRRSIRTLLTPALVVMFMALAPRAHAQDEAFTRGVDTLENKQFQAAAGLLRQAIKQRDQESTTRVGVNPVFRTGGREYLPHYYLGEALFGAGDCSGAVNEWATSEMQGIVQKVRSGEYYRKLQNGYAECEKKGVLPPTRLDPGLNRLAALIKEANTEYGNVQNLGLANPEVWKTDTGIRDQFDRARGEIENARARWEAARGSRLQAHLDEGANFVARARTNLAGVESSLKNAINTQQTAQRLVQQVGEAIAAADVLNNSIEGKKVAFTPAMTTALQEGRDSLTRAKERLAEGQKTLSQPTLNNARTLAQDAGAKLRQVLDDMAKGDRDSKLRLLTEASTRADETFSLLDAAVAALDRFINERGNKVPEPEKIAELKRNADRARRRLNDSRKTENVDGIAGATRTASELRDQFNLIIGSFGPLTLRDRGVAEQLEASARRYLAGEYQQAIASLGDTENLDAAVPLRLHFHLFKAAASYELFLRSRETDQALRSQAQAEIEHCKAIDSAFQPDARAFSPRFLSFYQTINAPAAAPLAAPQGVTAPSAN